MSLWRITMNLASLGVIKLIDNMVIQKMEPNRQKSLLSPNFKCPYNDIDLYQ